MPIYEYVCAVCGTECEVLQKISEPPATTCPHCGKDALTKEVSAVGFRLKGNGWYETDFKTSNRHNVVDTAPAGASPSKADAQVVKKDGDGKTSAKPPAAKAADSNGSASAANA